MTKNKEVKKEMKMMKKVTSLVLAGAMTLAMSVSAFAATGISAEEQKILDTAAVKAAELGVSTSSAQYQKYYSQATTYLQQNDMDATQINGALTAMDQATAEAKAAMQEAGVTSLLDLDKDKLTSLTSTCATTIQKELDKAGIKVQVSADGTVSFTENKKTDDGVKNNTVVNTGSVIKQTGSDMTATAAVAVAVVGAVAACGVVAKKKGLLSTEA